MYPLLFLVELRFDMCDFIFFIGGI